MGSLRDAVALRSTGEHGFEWAVPPGFGQGKATFGGLVLGAIVAAMKRTISPERPLRTLQAELLAAPQPGPCDITLRLLRRTGTTETLVGELRQHGELTTHAVGVFGDARPVPDRVSPSIALPDWRSVTPMPRGVPFAPEFTQHFEYRVTRNYPFCGADDRVTAGWVRPRDEDAPRDEVLLTMLVDAWWLAAFVSMKAPRPGVTLTFALDLHDRYDDLPRDVPLYHRGELIALRDGYATETRELWGSDGRLIALNRQSIVIVK